MQYCIKTPWKGRPHDAKASTALDYLPISVLCGCHVASSLLIPNTPLLLLSVCTANATATRPSLHFSSVSSCRSARSGNTAPQTKSAAKFRSIRPTNTKYSPPLLYSLQYYTKVDRPFKLSVENVHCVWIASVRLTVICVCSCRPTNSGNLDTVCACSGVTPGCKICYKNSFV